MNTTLNTAVRIVHNQIDDDPDMIIDKLIISRAEKNNGTNEEYFKKE